MQTSRHFLIFAFGAIALVPLVGCQEEEIRHYQVPKEDTTRLLAAIVPHGDKTWFFKVMGPIQEVGKHEEAFNKFIQSVRFTDEKDKPVAWDIPEGWREEAGNKIRYATFRLGPDKDALELTVIPLPTGAGSMLDNVNRWREQLGAFPVSELGLQRFTKPLKIEGSAALLVDMSGPGQSKAVASALPRGPMVFKTPEDWQPGDTKGMHFAAFQVADGDKRVEITITPLPGRAGSLLENINRWRGQIMLEPIDAEELNKDMREVSIGGQTGQSVELSGANDRIIGAIVKRGKTTWFFKLKGPVDLVEKQKPAFESFLGTVKFGGKDG